MKLLFCQACGDIVSPLRQSRRIRKCICGLHAVWWEEPQAGILRVSYTQAVDGKPIGNPSAFVIGLTNMLLNWPSEKITAEDVTAMIDRHDDFYIFRKIRSLVLRIRPGESSDTAWAPLPEGQR